MHEMKRLAQRTALTAAFLLFCTLPAQAQPSAREILASYTKNLEDQMEGVEDFTVKGQVQGLPDDISTTTYYRRSESGMPVFQSHTQVSGAPKAATETMSQTDMLTMSRKLYDYFGDSATYEATETVDGEKTHVLHIDDLTRLYEDMRGAGQRSGQAEARNARVYIDADEPVLRKLTADVYVSQQGKQRKLNMTTLMQDYRAVESMMYPYRTVIQMDYLLSDKEKMQMQQRLKQAEQMLDKLPDQRRAQMKKQLEAMQAMADGKTKITMQAQDVSVNTGVPDKYFE